MTIGTVEVPYTYLKQQFHPDNALTQDIMRDISDELTRGYFTLGPWVEKFEQAICNKYKVKHCVAVNSGTDALMLSLKALGIGSSHSVVTAPNTFVATVGAIAAVGAKPVFVDVGEDYQIDMEQAVECAADSIIPVHLTGLAKPCQNVNNILYDGAQAMDSKYDGQSVTNFPVITAFSLHPLKNLNVWGDGGLVTTNNDHLADEVCLLRNHGLSDRDTVKKLGYNSRLDSIQAIVAWHGLKQTDWVTEQRIQCAKRYDEGLLDCKGVTVPVRDPLAKQVYHTYVLTVDDRDNLHDYLIKRGVQSKIHYPVPLHLQPACTDLGYKEGDFPVCEWQADHIISLPIHQYLATEQIDWVIESIRNYYL